MNDKVIVALDVQTMEDFKSLTLELKGHASYVKVGMELYYTFGPQIIKELKQMGYKVFLDLKIHDIPNTAMQAAKTITKLGVDMINVHAAGGKEMMVAARIGMEQALNEDSSLKRPLLIAVTQLTSSVQTTLEEDLLIHRPLNEVVIHYALKAKEAGLDGVVCSVLELKQIKKDIGPEFIAVTPGIRPKGIGENDQKRVSTPQDALKSGVDFMVIGRAITQAKEPSKAYDQIIKSLKEE